MAAIKMAEELGGQSDPDSTRGPDPPAPLPGPVQNMNLLATAASLLVQRLPLLGVHTPQSKGPTQIIRLLAGFVHKKTAKPRTTRLSSMLFCCFLIF